MKLELRNEPFDFFFWGGGVFRAIWYKPALFSKLFLWICVCVFLCVAGLFFGSLNAREFFKITASSERSVV